MNPRENPNTKWLQDKFETWRYQKGVRKTITEFAAYIGISEEKMLEFMNGTEQPKGSNLAKIAGILGFEIYELNGIKTSEMLDSLPPHFRVRFATAFSEYLEILQENQMDRDTPGAQQTLKDIFEKYKLEDLLK